MLPDHLLLLHPLPLFSSHPTVSSNHTEHRVAPAMTCISELVWGGQACQDILSQQHFNKTTKYQCLHTCSFHYICVCMICHTESTGEITGTATIRDVEQTMQTIADSSHSPALWSLAQKAWWIIRRQETFKISSHTYENQGLCYA